MLELFIGKGSQEVKSSGNEHSFRHTVAVQKCSPQPRHLQRALAEKPSVAWEGGFSGEADQEKDGESRWDSHRLQLSVGRVKAKPQPSGTELLSPEVSHL